LISAYHNVATVASVAVIAQQVGFDEAMHHNARV
jgi:hypothetical protein